MSTALKDSETLQNLMRAFAGESQARNRYTFAADLCRKQKLYVLEAVFTYTAGQELAHAEIFWNHMKPVGAEKVEITAGYPAQLTQKAAELLRFAQRDELTEYSDVYPAFADTAQQEGFSEIANSFRRIAEIEQTHALRFHALAELLEAGKLFVSDAECEWICLNCGHIHNGKEAPQKCPVCQHEQGYFIRLELAPYATPGMHSDW